MFKNLLQVGIVTGDIIRILKNYVDVYNIGPWYFIKFSPENVDSMTLYGKKQAYSMNIAVCPIGDVRFEYIEPITDSIYLNFLKDYGEGFIHHLKLGVEDHTKALDFLESKNIDIIQSGHQLGDRGKNIYTYVDTKKQLGFITEVVHVTEDFIKPEPQRWFPPEKRQFDPVFLGPSAAGIVVRDVEAKIRDYQCLNIGPWEVHDFGNKYNPGFKAKIAYCRLGNVVFELIEPRSISIFSEFLEKSGENIHHIKMEVDDYGKVLKYLGSRGIEVVLSGRYPDDGASFSFLDTRKQINFITEISDKWDF